MGLAFQNVPKKWVLFPSHTCMYEDDEDDGDGHDDDDYDDGDDGQW